MALYDRSYSPWQGKKTSRWSRFLVISRYGSHNVFTTRFSYNIFLLGILVPLFPLIIIYIRANLDFLQLLGLEQLPFSEIDTYFFKKYMVIQSVFCWIIVFLTTPDLFVDDLSQNGFVSYFTRPLTWWEYLLGKATILFVIQSFILWLPILVLFAFHISITDNASFWSNHRFLPPAIIVAGTIFILFDTTIAFTLTIVSKTKQRARAAMLVIFILSLNSDDITKILFRSDVGKFINLKQLTTHFWDGLFRLESTGWITSLGIMIIIVFFCLIILHKKTRPFTWMR